ncbi:unnamed protein product [Gordionus sp. m RMFG-2023]
MTKCSQEPHIMSNIFPQINELRNTEVPSIMDGESASNDNFHCLITRLWGTTPTNSDINLEANLKLSSLTLTCREDQSICMKKIARRGFCPKLDHQGMGDNNITAILYQ